jgi:flagellar basal body-associated protein FliL
MKTIRIAIIILICMSLCACGNTVTVTGNTAASTTNKSEPAIPTENSVTAAEYRTIEELSGYSDVVSVTKVTYDLSELDMSTLNSEQTAQANGLINDTVTYEIIYQVDGFRIVGYISAPADYLT